jgi:hypothetical protein
MLSLVLKLIFMVLYERHLRLQSVLECQYRWKAPLVE